MVVIVIGVGFAERLITLYPHQNKRNFKKRLRHMKPLFSGWSTLSRIDVMGRKTKNGIRAQIWINGGQNQSFLAVLTPRHLSHPNWNESINYPYIFMRDKRPDVLIIGSSGGTEVVYALSHRSRHVDAVEMDPLICKLVKEDFKVHNHRLFNRGEVSLINDEGRSFVLNGKRKYDLIQMRNNFTPIAIASGAINLSETYLLTVEGMKDYMEDLKEDGILALNRWGSIRLCTTVRKAFEETGRKNMWKHVVIMTGETWMLNGFYFKNSPFTDKEIAWTKEFARIKHLKVLYHPDMAKDENLYAKVLKGETPSDYYQFAGFDLSPPTDERPFFNHFLAVGGGIIDLKNELFPSELKRIYHLFAWRPFSSSEFIVSKSDLPVVSLGIEAVLISFLLIFLPLKLKGDGKKGKWPFLIYFSILGIAFIMIELCLIKQFTLFLGIPAVSISMVIALLLLFSGLGSFLAERFIGRECLALRVILPVLFLVGLGFSLIYPWAVPFFLGMPFLHRMLVVTIFIFPLGIFMGMPFPLGLLLVHKHFPEMVGWVWGVNGFMTVIGSVATIIIALIYGFEVVFSIACVLYLLGSLLVGGMDVGKG
jgi:spermidine synthase